VKTIRILAGHEIRSAANRIASSKLLGGSPAISASETVPSPPGSPRESPHTQAGIGRVETASTFATPDGNGSPRGAAANGAMSRIVPKWHSFRRSREFLSPLRGSSRRRVARRHLL